MRHPSPCSNTIKFRARARDNRLPVQCRLGMAAAALQRGSWGLHLRIADIMSICASKIHVKLGCCQKVHLPAHFDIAT